VALVHRGAAGVCGGQALELGIYTVTKSPMSGLGRVVCRVYIYRARHTTRQAHGTTPGAPRPEAQHSAHAPMMMRYHMTYPLPDHGLRGAAVGRRTGQVCPEGPTTGLTPMVKFANAK
jgi:hypothetical protein